MTVMDDGSNDESRDVLKTENGNLNDIILEYLRNSCFLPLIRVRYVGKGYGLGLQKLNITISLRLGLGLEHTRYS